MSEHPEGLVESYARVCAELTERYEQVGELRTENDRLTKELASATAEVERLRAVLVEAQEQPKGVNVDVEGHAAVLSAIWVCGRELDETRAQLNKISKRISSTVNSDPVRRALDDRRMAEYNANFPSR